MNKALFKYFATVLIITLLFSSSVSMVILSDQMMQTTRKDMYYTVKLVENQIDYQKPLDNQVEKLNDLAYTKDTRLTIIDKEGNVLADSDKEGIQENHSGRSEFKEALSDQFGYTTRYSSTVKKNMMYVAYYHRGYVVRIAIPYNGIFDNIGPLLEPLFISAALSLCVALALSYRFSRTLTKPLEEISEEVSKINDNRYLSFDHYQYEEFNVIATKLKEQADTIRKTLKTLKNERLKINSILDKMNEGFILLDTNYEILMVNKKAKQLFSDKMEVNQPIQDFIFDHQIIDQLENIGVEPKIVTLKKDEEVYDCHLAKVEYGVTLLFVNVTESVNATKMRQEFFSNVSHELKTPMTSIRGYSELLQAGMINDPKVRKQSLDKIQKEVDHMSQLIGDILMISRLENKDIEVIKHPVHLQPIVDDILESLKVEIEKREIKVICDLTPQTYLANHQHVQQLMNNLINNAVKYTKEGQIDIKVSKNEEETKLIFEVKDTGIGIKEENLPVLFDAFMRVDSKKNKKIKGTGLGLAIAKQLAEQMDGMIWVESVYGKGSSFFVQLPMKKVSDGKISNVEWKETDERKRRSFVAPQAKILIVDDNPENLMVTRSLLKRTAVFVDTAASGEECVHKVRQNVYDLILLDYMMPQMDGIDTIRELKKDVQFHIPVIALTADVTKGIEQTFLREGFCAYLSKPVMWSKLEDLLMKYLRDDLVFIREDLKEEQKIKDEEFKQLKGQLKENDIKIEEGLRLLDGDFMQYRKLMEFFTEYQEEYMRQMQQLMTQNEVKVDEITRMMHTLKSNAKAIGAIHLYEIAKEMEDRGKQKDMEYIMSAYDLLKLEWGRVFKASREFIEQTKNVLFDQKKEEEKDKQSKEEIKEKLKIFITRYQAKEAKEQIQYYRKGKISEEERNILKEMEIRIDQLDFDEAEILMKRWEGME